MPKGFCGCVRGEGRPCSGDLLVGCLVPALVSACRWRSADRRTAQTTRSEESRFSRSAEAEITFQEGVLQYTRKQLPEAEENFRKVIKADANDAEAYYYLGLAQLDQAQDALTRSTASIESLRLDPTRQEVRAARATANIRVQKYDAARADVDKLAPIRDGTAWCITCAVRSCSTREISKRGQSEFAAAKAAGGTEAGAGGISTKD